MKGISVVKTVSQHTTQHTDSFIFMYKKLPSVNIYIPKNRKGNPDIIAQWHVYFYFPIPGSGTNGKGKKYKKFCYYKDLNRYKTVRERKQYAKALKKAIENLLHKGFNPFAPDTMAPSFEENKTFTLVEALTYAFENKKKEWKESTLSGIEYRMNAFIRWAKQQGIYTYDIKDIHKKHLIAFLNHISGQINSTSVNNYKASLGALFSKLAHDDIIPHNFLNEIPKRNAKAIKNKPFTGYQIANIREYLLKNDLYLYSYIKFMTYAFLRCVEVIRITVGDVDMKNNLIYVETKTQRRAVVRIIELLNPTLEAMQLHRYDARMSLFSPSLQPDFWSSPEKTKVDFFGERFRLVKKHFGFNNDYGLYSFRHTFILDLFNSFIKQGLSERDVIFQLLSITRHTNEKGLRNYLRDVGGLLPKDYGENYTINF